jgi:beta-phosphoglucomutase
MKHDRGRNGFDIVFNLELRTLTSALLFDLDGVIIDSMPMHTQAWRTYLERLGIASDDIESRMHGRRNDEIVTGIIGAHLGSDVIAAHGAAKEQLFRELMQHRLQTQLVPGVVDFLESCDGFPKGLASNAEPANIAFVLDGLELRRYFQVIVDGHQVDRPKPFPDIYFRAAELLGIPPRDCVIFEDSPTGVAAALAAGAKVVGVLTHPADLAGVDLLISDFRDPALKKWLESVEPRI